MLSISYRKPFPWIIPEWRWWLRFNQGVYYRKPYRIKRRFESLSFMRIVKQKVKFNERFGTPRKQIAFDKMRLKRVIRIKNKFHFTRVLS
jgi:hypothetical protein